MEKLNPEIIKSNLVRCSLYLTAFELLKQAIITKTWDFLTLRFFNDQDAAEACFNEEVMEKFAPRDRRGRVYDKYLASCRWLVHLNAIDENDVEILIEIRATSEFDSPRSSEDYS